MINVENPILFDRVNKFLGKEVKNWTLLRTIEELLKAGEQQRHEYATLSESIAESDAIITQLQKEIEHYKLKEKLDMERNKKYRERIFELKRKTGLEVYQENLNLKQEIAHLKELVKA